jgi:hypothetical protein
MLMGLLLLLMAGRFRWEVLAELECLVSGGGMVMLRPCCNENGHWFTYLAIR